MPGKAGTGTKQLPSNSEDIFRGLVKYLTEIDIFTKYQMQCVPYETVPASIHTLYASTLNNTFPAGVFRDFNVFLHVYAYLWHVFSESCSGIALFQLVLLQGSKFVVFW